MASRKAFKVTLSDRFWQCVVQKKFVWICALFTGITAVALAAGVIFCVASLGMLQKQA